MALVIPSYVPLHRLPAASGLQLISAGIFYFFMGPVVGTFILFFAFFVCLLFRKKRINGNLKSNFIQNTQKADFI